MDKEWIRQQIINRLHADLEKAGRAAGDAHSIATAEENKAENKYDTLALEASYLAQGQSKRVAELDTALITYTRCVLKDFDKNTPIDVTACVCIETKRGEKQRFFIGPAMGGMTIGEGEDEITVLTLKAPLGAALEGKKTGDSGELMIHGLPEVFRILKVY
jgi:transcription elongation GreA/GreB family factor